MQNPTLTRSTDDEVLATSQPQDEHVSPDRSVIGPYSVEMPEPRD
jgi:hypothetical protein